MSTITKSHGTSSALMAAPVPALLAVGPVPLSWWKLDEGGLGSPALDSGGGGLGAAANDNNSTTGPAGTVAPVKFSNLHARGFPPGNVGLITSVQPAHRLFDNFSISVWVKPASFTYPIAIMSRLNTTYGTGWNIFVNNGSPAGVPYFHVMNGPGNHTYAGGGAALPLNAWSHIACVMGGGVRILYVNGVPQGNFDNSPVKFAIGDAATLIGEWAYDLSAPWNGALDDLRYYDIQLTIGQIQSLAYGNELANVTITLAKHTANLYCVRPVTLTHTTSNIRHGTVTRSHTTSTNVIGTLVGWWKLDEVGTAQTAIDSAPLQAHAPDQGGFTVNVTAAPITAPTNFPNTHSRRFPGPPNNWLNAGVQPNHGFTQNFTVACWVRSPSPASVPLVTHQNASPTNKGWGLMVGGTGSPIPVNTPIFQACTPTGATLIAADASLQNNVWTHVAAVVYASSARLFVNGKKQTAVLTTMPTASPTLPTYIGRDYSLTGGATQFIGDLDDIRIYSIPLSDDQIQTLAYGNELATTTVVSVSHGTDAKVVSTAANYAKFIQQDNWRNGINWIGQYGQQGYSIFGGGDPNPDVLPSGVTYTTAGGSYDYYDVPGVYSDPRYLRLPNELTKSVAGVFYTYGTESFTFLFGDAKPHALSFYMMNEVGPTSKYNISVYDADTNALLAGPLTTGDYNTTGVYFTWNVQGHVRFEFTAVVSYATASAFFIDPPMSVGTLSHGTDTYTPVPVTVTVLHYTDTLRLQPVLVTHSTNALLPMSVSVTHGTDALLPATMVHAHGTNAKIVTATPVAAVATFVQRDNWRNAGNWIGQYGSQGYSIFDLASTPDVVPPGVSGWNTLNHINPWTPASSGNGPRFVAIPGQPGVTGAAVYYTNTTGTFEFSFDDGLAHSLTFLFLDKEQMNRRGTVAVLDGDSSSQLDGPRDVGDYATTSVYMTYNVKGHLQFVLTCTSDPATTNITPVAWFIDPPMSIGGVSHSTSSDLSVVSNLISYWKLDESGTGLIAADSGTAGANATDVLGTTTPSTPAPLNFANPRGRTLPGDGTYLDAGVQPAHSLTTNFTVAGWVRNPVVDFAVVASHHDYPSTQGWSLLLLNNNVPGFYTCSASGGDHPLFSNGGAVDVGVWTHLAGVVYDDRKALFVNGQDRTSGAPQIGDPSPGLPTYIGKWRSGTGYYGGSSNADFDDIRIYNVALTAEQIQILANGNDPFAFTVVTITHGTDSVTVQPVTVVATHNTNSLLSLPVIKTHGTNSLLLLPVIKTHGTDANIAAAAPLVTVRVVTHVTDSLLPLPVTTVTLTHGTDANTATLPAVFAQFVQRDNWRNGAWIGQYGTQGYSLFRDAVKTGANPGGPIPDVMPSGVSYTIGGHAYDQGVVPDIYTDPRLLQDPTRPGDTELATYYSGDGGPFTFVLGDGLSHAISLYSYDYYDTGSHHSISVYNADTNALLDGPRETGGYKTTAIYMTWNVRGHVKFVVTPEVNYTYTMGLFIDPPRSVGGQTHTTNTAISPPPVTVTVANYTDAYVARAIVTVTVTHKTDARIVSVVTKKHNTDTNLVPAPPAATAVFVQRDNWRNGINWIGNYGSQGYSVSFNWASPDVMPPGVSYTTAGGNVAPWVNPGVNNDPRLLQVPGQPTQSMVFVFYTGGTESVTFLLDDGHSHNISLYNLSYDIANVRFTVAVYDADTNALLDGPYDVGDVYTTGVYMSWNVQRHVRFDLTKVVDKAAVSALFIDPPRSVVGKTHGTDTHISVAPVTVTVTHGTNTSLIVAPPPPATAMFVQRDNWLGGAWINQYGTQGYAVFLSGTPNVLPPGTSYKVAGGKYDCWLPPGTYDDPRLPQVPGQPDKTEAAVYHTEDVECFFFAFADGLEHAVSIFSLDYDQGDLRHQIEVYDNNTDVLLDGPRDVGDQYTNSVYMTWNVSGSVRFELVTEAENAVATAWFIDPPMSVGTVTHHTSSAVGAVIASASFVQRDNWRNGAWIGQYGSQGYSVFGSGQPDRMPPGTSYTKTGGTQGWWTGVGIHVDPRFPQVPNNPTQTVGGVYWSDTGESFSFFLDDSLFHSVSIYSLSNDTNTQRQQIAVYDANTNALLDGPQEVGEIQSNAAYMTWNVRGRVRFDVIQEVEQVLTSAFFVDPAMSIGAVSHGTDNLTSRLAIATITITHRTSSVISGLPLVGSRSRSQRVGTRTLAFGD